MSTSIRCSFTVTFVLTRNTLFNPIHDCKSLDLVTKGIKLHLYLVDLKVLT